MPAVAEILCQRCGARTEALIAPRRRFVDPCRCGGIRQVVRVVHHQGGEVRRCEVVMAAASWAHGQDGGHVRRVHEAHGEGNMPRYIDGGVLRLAAAAEPGAYSNGGFAATYAASERVIGLLRGGWPPRTGPRADLGPLTEGLGDVLELAREDEAPLDALTSATHVPVSRLWQHGRRVVAPGDVRARGSRSRGRPQPPDRGDDAAGVARGRAAP
jgi:hypothetical protein